MDNQWVGTVGTLGGLDRQWQFQFPGILHVLKPIRRRRWDGEKAQFPEGRGHCNVYSATNPTQCMKIKALSASNQDGTSCEDIKENILHS
jgi:hypothetical protein